MLLPYSAIDWYKNKVFILNHLMWQRGENAAIPLMFFSAAMS